MEVPTSPGSMSEIQQQLSSLSRQMGQLASRLADSERQRAEETANAAALQAAQRAEEVAAERTGGRRVELSRMSSLLAVQRTLDGRSVKTTAAGSIADEKQQQQRTEQRATFCEQGEVESPILGGNRAAEDCWTGSVWAATLAGWKIPFGDGKVEASGDFGSAEGQNYSNDALGESDFGVIKGVKWQIPAFDCKNNLQGSKEPLTCAVLEDAQRSRYSAQPSGEKGKSIFDTALFASRSKASRGGGRGGGRGGKGKREPDSRGRGGGHGGKCKREPDSRDRDEEFQKGKSSLQVKMTCNHGQKPGHIRPNSPERQCFKYRGWGHEADSCPFEVKIPEKKGSSVMAVH